MRTFTTKQKKARRREERSKIPSREVMIDALIKKGGYRIFTLAGQSNRHLAKLCIRHRIIRLPSG